MNLHILGNFICLLEFLTLLSITMNDILIMSRMTCYIQSTMLKDFKQDYVIDFPKSCYLNTKVMADMDNLHIHTHKIGNLWLNWPQDKRNTHLSRIHLFWKELTLVRHSEGGCNRRTPILKRPSSYKSLTLYLKKQHPVNCT